MNTPLPHWIQRFLGIETEAGEGMVWRLEHSWAWPPWVTVLLVVGATVFVFWNYVRENPESSRRLRMALAMVRLSLIGLVLVMLAQLALLLNRTGLPYLAVLVDDSLSMSILDSYEKGLQEELLQRLEKYEDEQATPDTVESSEPPAQESAAEGVSRWDLVRLLLAEREGRLLDRLQSDYNLRLYYLTGMRIAEGRDTETLVRELSEREPSGASSPLGAGLRAVLGDLRGSSPAAVILVSDGINTEGPRLEKAVAQTKRRGIPLFTVTLGNESRARDVELRDVLVEEVVFVNDILQFECMVSATGFDEQKATIVLREEGDPAVLAQVETSLRADGQLSQVRLAHRPSVEGEFRYIIEVLPQEGELRSENNSMQRTVRVRDEKIRVLLVQGFPTFEFRFLRNMLSRDASIELHTVLQDADLEHAEQDAAALSGFPVRRDELFGYDVVILADADPSRLTASMMRNLVDFVQDSDKGGSLVCIAGPSFMPLAYRETPLAPLLPVRLENARLPDPRKPLTEEFTLRPTELGWNSPAFQLGDTPDQTRDVWETLPSLYWMVETPDVRPGAKVLARHSHRRTVAGEGLPLISMQYVGGGQVLFHNIDATWRWRRRSGDTLFARYWVQALRHLSRAKLADDQDAAELTVERREYRLGESVGLRLRFGDPRQAPPGDTPVTVILECAGERNRQVLLTRVDADRAVFEGRIRDAAVGSYHAWVAVPTLSGRAAAVDFRVVAPPGELERVESDLAGMRSAAEGTGGQAYSIATASKLLGDLPPGRHVPVEALPPIPLWNRWPLLCLFLVLLISEWLLRKKGKMV